MTIWSVIRNFIKDASLFQVINYMEKERRIDYETALLCMRSDDVVGLGAIANMIKREQMEDRVTYVLNHHINYTNICKNSCHFCTFQRRPDSSDAYTMTPADVALMLSGESLKDIREAHIVGGCHPELGLRYYCDMLESIKLLRPDIGLKAFTAVEIDNISRIEGISTKEVLMRLVEKGLDALPGGGAEIFSDEIRKRLFRNKIDANTWLRIHQEAHELGLKTNATMLFGHLESHEHRVRHLIMLREQQDISGGFQAFIPLPFIPPRNGDGYLHGPTGLEILKTISVSRIVLDNIPHIKAYWVMLGLRLTLIALHFGADDIEGTVIDERIAHEAGAKTEKGLTKEQIETLIRRAGLTPVQRDTFHREVKDVN